MTTCLVFSYRGARKLCEKRRGHHQRLCYNLNQIQGAMRTCPHLSKNDSVPSNNPLQTHFLKSTNPVILYFKEHYSREYWFPVSVITFSSQTKIIDLLDEGLAQIINSKLCQSLNFRNWTNSITLRILKYWKTNFCQKSCVFFVRTKTF